MFIEKKYSLSLSDHLSSGETIGVGGFLDTNSDGILEVYLFSERRNDGDIYSPATRETLDPSGQHIFSPNLMLASALGKNFYSPYPAFGDFNNDGNTDLAILDAGDESRTHYYQLYGESVSKKITVPSIGAEAGLFSFANNSAVHSSDLSVAIERHRNENPSDFQQNIQRLIPYFGTTADDIPPGVLRWIRPYNAVAFDFNSDGFDDLFVENGSDGIGPNQFLFDGKAKSIDANFTRIWRETYTKLLGINYQRFREYEIVSSNDGTVWIVAGTMREADDAYPDKDPSYMLRWQNLLLGFKKTASGWTATDKIIIPLPNWADNFISPAGIWILRDENGRPDKVFINHNNDRTNKFGYFLGNYLQAVEIDLTKNSALDVTSIVFPQQRFPSLLIKEDGSPNRSGPTRGHQFNDEFFDINRDGFDDLIASSNFRTSNYAVPIWLNSGLGTFLPASEVYLQLSGGSSFLPQAFADSDNDGLLNFWRAYSTKQGADVFDYEVADFNIDPIFGKLPRDFGIAGFNGAYVCQILGMNAEEINKSNVKVFFDRAISDLSSKNLNSFAPNSTVYGFTDKNDVIRLQSGNEKAFGYSGDDTFIGLSGNDFLDGSIGVDVAIYRGTRSEYQISTKSNGLAVSDKIGSRDGSDDLIGIERLQFSDLSLALDAAGNAGKAYRVYKAAFARDPMTGDQAGLGYWISNIDRGMDMVEVAARFIDSPEFRTLYGQNPSKADFLAKVYTNVLGRSPDQGGYSWWLNELNTNPSKTKAKVLADFAESQENKDSVANLIGNGIQYTEFVA